MKDTPVNTAVFPWPQSINEGPDYRKWSSTDSMSAADELLRYGDKKNARRIIEVSAPGHISAQDIKPRRERSVYGGAVNVGAALSGRPKAMYRNVMKKTDTKVLNFIYNVSVSWKIKPAQIAEVAARLTSAICGIEKKGYRVNLYVCKVSKEASEVAGIFVKIKDSGTYMDKVKMAYPLINPSMLRRQMFAALERSEVTERSWGDDYGCCADDDTEAEAARRAGINARRIVNYNKLSDMDTAQIIDYLMKD